MNTYDDHEPLELGGDLTEEEKQKLKDASEDLKRRSPQDWSTKK